MMQHTELRFGGNANRGQIAIEQAELTLTNSRLLSGDFGISITEADPVISNVHFQSHKRSALTMDLLSNPDFENITFTGNATNGVEIPGGTLAANTNWDDPGVVYRLLGDITIPTGVTLDVAAGQIVKASGTTKLIVAGTLQSHGTPGNRAIFTSYRDDSAGGDTDNSGPSVGVKSDWERIDIVSGGAALLDGFEARYAGRGFSGSDYALSVNGGDLSLTHGALVGSDHGLEIVDSDPIIHDVHFEDHRLSTIRMDLASDPDLENITFTGNGTNGVEVLGGSLESSRNWDDPGVVYRLLGDVTIPSGVSLDVAAGQIVKASGTTKLIVEGILRAHGTPGNHAIFTSYRDDTAGGDTDNSGPSTGSQSDWERIEIASGGNAILNGFEARYGGRAVHRSGRVDLRQRR